MDVHPPKNGINRYWSIPKLPNEYQGGWMKIPAVHVCYFGLPDEQAIGNSLGWWTGHQKNDVWWIWGAWLKGKCSWSSRSTSIAICKLWMGYTALPFRFGKVPLFVQYNCWKPTSVSYIFPIPSFFQWQSTHIDTGKPFTDSTFNLVLAGSQSKLGNSSGSNCEKRGDMLEHRWAEIISEFCQFNLIRWSDFNAFAEAEKVHLVAIPGFSRGHVNHTQVTTCHSHGIENI